MSRADAPEWHECAVEPVIARPPTRIRTSSRWFAMVLSIAVATVCAGCASTTGERVGTAAPTTAAPTPPSSPQPVPAAPTSVSLPASGDLYRTANTVYTGCVGKSSAGTGFDTTTQPQIFDPASGKFVAMPHPVLADGEELVSTRCVVWTDSDRPEPIYLTTTRLPSSGLAPEKVSHTLESFDLNGRSIRKADWPSDENLDDYPHIEETSAGFVLINISKVIGFDGKTLAKTFASTTGSSDFSRTAFVRQASVPADHPGEDTRLTFYSTSDGTEIGKFQAPFAYVDMVTNDGYVVHRADYPKNQPPSFPVFYFDTHAHELSGPIAPQASHFQKFGNRILAYDKANLTIYDTQTKQSVLHRSGADVTGLNIANAYLAGNYLYIDNLDDSPVVDITTGRKVGSGWKLRPTDEIGDGWTLVVTGKISNNYPTCFDNGTYRCSQRGVLVRNIESRYPGPWF